VARGLPVARLAARTAAARLGGKVRKGDEQAQLDRFTREAERYVRVLGDMKGVAMKLGQLVSFLDAGAIPEQYRAIYQQIVGALQADAPPMPVETVLDVVERELGRPPGEVFEWFGGRPMAAASIGQVHAAHLVGGREVVVKVQYPGVAEAIAADLANTELLTSIINLGTKLMPMKIGSDARAMADEIRDRVTEELDYRIEAANQADFAEWYRGHPFIRVPELVPELCTERVLVMDEVDGLRWTAALEQPQELKDTWGEVINRFVYGSLYDHRAFNADPHPGNYLFHDDGGVSFIDFGCVKRFREDQLAVLRRIGDALWGGPDGEGDAELLLRCYQDLHLVPEDTKLSAERVMGWVRPVWSPVVADQPFTFTPEFAAFVIERQFDPFGEWGDVVRGFSVAEASKDWTFLTRIQLGLYSVLGALRSTGEWRAVHDELLRRAPPVTDLGRRHQAWLAGHAGRTDS
jgi:predicted unusual protein kinase regulating ubiquinone biosynthesis (AarF/ABC1/UbiB family)